MNANETECDSGKPNEANPWSFSHISAAGRTGDAVRSHAIEDILAESFHRFVGAFVCHRLAQSI